MPNLFSCDCLSELSLRFSSLSKSCAYKDMYWRILGSEHMFICSGQLHIGVKTHLFGKCGFW